MNGFSVLGVFKIESPRIHKFIHLYLGIASSELPILIKFFRFIRTSTRTERLIINQSKLSNSYSYANSRLKRHQSSKNRSLKMELID